MNAQLAHPPLLAGEAAAPSTGGTSTGVVTPLLSLTAHDRADLLWDELIAEWRADPDALLVLSSRTAAQRVVRQHADETLFGERVIALPDLWVRVARQFPDLPQPMTKLEARTVLNDLLDDPSYPEKLRVLRDTTSGVEALFDHLEEIEERADQDYRPQNDIEQAIQRLRDALKARERSTGVGYRSQIAREAHEAVLGFEGRRVLFGPIGQPTRYMVGLMKGLGVRHSVNVYVLTADRELDTLRADAGLDTDDVKLVDRLTERGFAARLFGGPAAPPEQHAEWVEATDEVEAAIEILADWIEQGVDPAQTALVMRSTDNHASRLEELAARRNVPLLLPARSSVRDSALGALLLRIANADLADPDDHYRLVGSAAPYPLTRDDLHTVAVHRLRGVIAELRALHDLGCELLERVLPATGQRLVRGQEARAHAWLDGLGKAISTFETYGARPDSAVEVLEDTFSSRQMRGHLDGVIVVNYVGASGFQFRNAVLCSLADGDYPMPQTRSPFVSPELLDATPKLKEIDRRPEFVATVASACDRVAFVRANVNPTGAEIAPSAFWVETLRAAEHPDAQKFSAETSPAPRRVLQRAARRRLRHDQVQRAVAQASRERLPRGVLKGEKTSYSVTELELYANCPYGWFVKQVLRPEPRPNPQARRGMILHDSLADAFAATVDPDDRMAVALDSLTRRGHGELSEVDLHVLRRKLICVIGTYGGPDWPFVEHLIEEPVSAKGILPDLPDYRIHGRADRIDIGAGKLLVIDYKTKRSPKLKAPGERAVELQRYLYPQLASRQLKAKPLGLLYVSLFHAEHEGSLAEPLAGLDMREVDVEHWQEETDAALALASEAIQRIEAGEWDEIGRNGKACRPHCPHHLISRTVTGG